MDAIGGLVVADCGWLFAGSLGDGRTVKHLPVQPTNTELGADTRQPEPVGSGVRSHGVGHHCQIYRFDEQGQGWVYIPGSLNQISVAADARSRV
jgi:hypothetical protein